jgi:hypothetical protein
LPTINPAAGHLVNTPTAQKKGWCIMTTKNQLINDACRAEELIPLDELEEYANHQQRNLATYLIHWKGIGRIVKLDPRITTAEDYAAIQEKFAKEANHGKTPDDRWDRYADMPRLDYSLTANGIPYNFDLCRDGGMFMLYKTPDKTNDQIAVAKKEIRRDHDVVSLNVLVIKKMI